MTRQNGLVILTISFYIMYGYLGMPGQGAFAIPFLLNETVLALVTGILVYYERKNVALAIHLAVLALSALTISPFFLEIILPQNDLLVLMNSGWFEVLKLTHYLVVCSVMISITVRQANGIQKTLGIVAAAILMLGVVLSIPWTFLPAYGMMIAAAYIKDGENSTVPLWIIMAFLELTKLIALLTS